MIAVNNDGARRSDDDAELESDERQDRLQPEAAAQGARQSPAHEHSAARIESLMRALADADNARKRAERHAAEVRQYAIGDFARDLLLVADNLRRALAAAESEAADSHALLEGVRATAKVLDSVLERHGVTRVESRGVPFDPRRHEAVAVIDDATREPGEIVDVAEEGYMISDRLLRPARVLVNNPDRKPASDIFSRGAGP